jgi:hypothetical protein
VRFILRLYRWRRDTQLHIEKEGEGAGYSESSNIKSDSLLHNLYVATPFPLDIAFVLYWIATATLLRDYSKTIGRLRFWTLVSLPLATSIIGSIQTYGSFISQLLQGIILTSSALFGVILFGLIFDNFKGSRKDHTISTQWHAIKRRS